MKDIISKLLTTALSIVYKILNVKRKMPLYCKEKLIKINENAPIEALEEAFFAFNIDTKEEQAHFLAQIIHESGHFKHKVENLNYSAKGLAQTLKTRFANADGTPNDLALEIQRNPMKIANAVYNGRMGNDRDSNDGWNYRGRGYIQLTGKKNYMEMGEYLYDKGMVETPFAFIDNPDLVAEEKYAVLTAVAFWKKNNIYRLPNDVKNITKRINGGYNGLKQRTALYEELV